MQAAATRTIFICHSSTDNSLVEEFRLHLDPLFRRSELRVWEDAELPTGRRWHENIQRELQNAAAVIVLVSPGLLRSEYVREHELPALMAAAELNKVPLYPVYVRPSVVEGVQFDVRMNGKVIARALSDYQGLNAPSRPLSEYSRKERESALPSWAKRISADLDSETGLVTGVVDSNPRPGSATLRVTVTTSRPDPTYGKIVNSTSVYQVHCSDITDLHKGDVVQIKQCRPYSKTKRHIFVRKLRVDGKGKLH